MSDPVTNVEIEDVLSSIRRLVSDGDKARTRDPAPVESEADPAHEAPEESAETPESKPARFVLTPALMVVANDSAPALTRDDAEDAQVEAEQADSDEDWVEELPDEPDTGQDNVIQQNDADEADDTTTDFEADRNVDNADIQDDVSFSDDDAGAEHGAADDEDEIDTDVDDEAADVVWGSVDEARKIGLAAVPESADEKPAAVKTTDRSGLIASIAELEAAVSKDDHDYEPDGSETADEMMGETIAWPGSVKRNTEDAQDAEEADDPVEGEGKADQPETDESHMDQPETDQKDDAERLEFEHRSEPSEDLQQDASEEQFDEADDDYDDDLDGLLDAGAVTLDDEALRALVSEIVREELTGPMGERITRNVRKLVRREIYRILSSQEFD